MADPNAFQALMSAPPRPQPHPVAPRSNRPVPIPGQRLQTLIGGPGGLKPDAETAWGERYGPESEVYLRSLELSTNRTNAERPGGREITGEEMELRETRSEQAKVEMEAWRARCLQEMKGVNALRNRVTTAHTGYPPVPDFEYDAFLARANVVDEKQAYLLHDPTVVTTQSADIKRLVEQKKSLVTELASLNSTSTNIRELSEALSSANAEVESLRRVKETLGQVKAEKDSLRRGNDSLQQEMDTLRQEKDALRQEKGSLQQEKDSLQREKDSLQQEKDSLQCEFRKTQDNLTDMSRVQVQLVTTQDLLQQVLQRQQTTVTGSPSTATSFAGQGAVIESSVPLNDHHRTSTVGAETSLENASESSSSGKRTATDLATQPSKCPRLLGPDPSPADRGDLQAGPSTSGLGHVHNQDPDVQPRGPGDGPAAAVPDYTFLKEVVNPFQSPKLPNSLWTKAQLPIGVTATVDAAMMAWSVKKSDWATPRKATGNCVDSHLNGRRLLKVSSGSYACRRCVDNRQPCVVVPKASKPVVLPLHPDKRPPNATWQEIEYWVKG